MSDRSLRVAICVLAAAGAAIAGYLLYERWTGGPLVCATGGCETVQNSRYSKVAGVPVALLGLLAYTGIFVTGLLRTELARAIGAALAVSGLAFALYLVYVQNSKIHAWCQWCLASDAILAALAVLTVVRLLREPEPLAGGAPAVAAPRRR
ncbi:MAG TPA: vitamin K epoxide reductase family protein [Gaiellaceae bacterium]|nr:vitamin K epoxide reductase family protein [Gaiellaceae bacterium]